MRRGAPIDTRTTPSGTYTLTELAALLGVDVTKVATILDEHGYSVPSGDERLPLTAEEYQELVLLAPPSPDDATGCA